MSEFGKRSGGGRRDAGRSASATSAVFTTVTRSQSVTVIDISRTGARIEGAVLPVRGEELVLKIGALQAFGSVRWVRGNRCGVQFDSRIDEAAVEQLRHEARLGTAQAYLDRQQAFEDWMTGLAR